MLTSLSIKNFALIDDLQLTTETGFTTLTGETGAGKSIILGALSLLLGKRADLDAVRDRSKKCVIEGEFAISEYRLQEVFDNEDLDYEDHSIIRREILPSGKSRGFVNDTPVRVKQMQELGKYLVDIHSQNESADLIQGNYRFDVIDALAQNKTLLSEYSLLYTDLKQYQKEYDRVKSEENEAASTHDYDLFLLQELREAGLQPGKQEELEQQQEVLSNVEVLKENLGSSAHQLAEEEIGVLNQLRDINLKMDGIKTYNKAYEELAERVNSILVEAEDVAVEIENQNESVEDDPQELQLINENLQEIYNLQKKHNTESEEELIQMTQDLQKRVDDFEQSEDRLNALQQNIDRLREKAKKKAKSLSTKRKKAAAEFSKAVEQTLDNLGMPEAEINIEFLKDEALNARGMDNMNWLLKANQGSRFQPIEKAASGGEQSRIILAIKSIMARYQHQPTIVFDEIDTGVSGEIAKKMGVVMQALARRRQVVSITHLPQIAAKGEHHFKVYKESSEGKTTTNIQALSKEERVIEIAGMLGGQDRSESARAHAKSLMTTLN